MDEGSRDTSPFGDWRIRLGITLGVIVFCMGVIGWDLVSDAKENPDDAWEVLKWVTIAMLGISALGDKWRK